MNFAIYYYRQFRIVIPEKIFENYFKSHFDGVDRIVPINILIL